MDGGEILFQASVPPSTIKSAYPTKLTHGAELHVLLHLLLNILSLDCLLIQLILIHDY